MSVRAGFKYFGSGALVYGMVAACSAGIDEMQSEHSNAPDGTGAELMNGGGESGRTEPLPGGRNSGPVPDANAQDCGTCTIEGPIAIEQPLNVAGPIQIEAPLQVVTADSDLSRLKAGDTGASNAVVVSGPFILTHALATSGDVFSIYVSEIDCSGSVTTSIQIGETAALQAGRVPVPEGSVLCTSTMNTGERLIWNGFVPY